MKVIKTINDMQTLAEEYRLSGYKIGFVPTMGYLHEGHLSLMRVARKHCDKLVVSIFVNPTQFGPDEDFEEYPRDFEKDERALKKMGCSAVFYPTNTEMYPEGYKTYVTVEEITSKLCGKSRPTHFRGVTTVVSKLFNIVRPHIAVFGQKDAQQAIVIKRMVRDLNFGIDIKVAPIIREEDGIAMSSRNTYLSEQERVDARVLYQSLQMAKKMIQDGERDADKIRTKMKQMINKEQSTRIDYVSIVDTENLEEVNEISGKILIALAVYVGKPRLIDNMMMTV